MHAELNHGDLMSVPKKTESGTDFDDLFCGEWSAQSTNDHLIFNNEYPSMSLEEKNNDTQLFMDNGINFFSNQDDNETAFSELNIKLFSNSSEKDVEKLLWRSKLLEKAHLNQKSSNILLGDSLLDQKTEIIDNFFGDSLKGFPHERGEGIIGSMDKIPHLYSADKMKMNSPIIYSKMKFLDADTNLSSNIIHGETESRCLNLHPLGSPMSNASISSPNTRKGHKFKPPNLFDRLKRAQQQQMISNSPLLMHQLASPYMMGCGSGVGLDWSPNLGNNLSPFVDSQSLLASNSGNINNHTLNTAFNGNNNLNSGLFGSPSHTSTQGSLVNNGNCHSNGNNLFGAISSTPNQSLSIFDQMKRARMEQHQNQKIFGFHDALGLAGRLGNNMGLQKQNRQAKIPLSPLSTFKRKFSSNTGGATRAGGMTNSDVISTASNSSYTTNGGTPLPRLRPSTTIANGMDSMQNTEMKKMAASIPSVISSISGETLEKNLSNFLRDTNNINMETTTVAELKQMLRNYELNAMGKKAELLERVAKVRQFYMQIKIPHNRSQKFTDQSEDAATKRSDDSISSGISKRKGELDHESRLIDGQTLNFKISKDDKKDLSQPQRHTEDFSSPESMSDMVESSKTESSHHKNLSLFTVELPSGNNALGDLFDPLTSDQQNRFVHMPNIFESV